MILEPRKIKSVTVPIVSPSTCHEVMGPDAMISGLSFQLYDGTKVIPSQWKPHFKFSSSPGLAISCYDSLWRWRCWAVVVSCSSQSATLSPRETTDTTILHPCNHSTFSTVFNKLYEVFNTSNKIGFALDDFAQL